MSQPPLPFNERERLAALHGLMILDTPNEERFDRITRLATRMFNVPIALVSLVDAERQWFKSCQGLDVPGTHRSESFCAYAVASGEPLIVVDTEGDARFQAHPLVIGDPHIRFYTGIPLFDAQGFALGTFCLIDRVPRELTPAEFESLRDLAAIAEAELNAVETNQLMARQRESELKVRQALEEAERASRAKSAFLANMSHELRTPLNAILGYSEMLAEEAEETGQDASLADLKKIHMAGKHLLNLINDILDLSKIEAGKMDLFLEELDPGVLVAEVADMVRPLAVKNGNRMVLEVDPQLPVMTTDGTKLRQVLFNMLSNAAKFTENGTITLTVKVRGLGISFKVQDTGIGMSAGQLDGLYQEFTQADASTTRKYGGTGLGLAISRRFCQLLGGDISATSELATGSVFTVWLPTLAPSAAQTTTVEDGHTLQAGQRTVLVIDDDPVARDLMERTLHKEGYGVLTAASGREGLRLALKYRPAAITLDAMMPGMDGWEVLAELKSQPELVDVPVIMVTMVDDKSRGYALGAAEFMLKPVDRNRLATILRSTMQGGRGGPVLLIDSEDTSRQMFKRLLEKEGLPVVEATDGPAALATLQEVVPSLILLDLTLPGMDGFAFLEAMKAQGLDRGAPVIALADLALTPAQHDRLANAVRAVLSKNGTDQTELMDKVMRQLAASIPQEDEPVA